MKTVTRVALAAILILTTINIYMGIVVESQRTELRKVVESHCGWHVR